MRLLYHLWLSPACRKIRVVLQEKGLDFTMKVEKVWERRPEFLALNPAGDVPVLIEPDGTVLAESGAIAEFLDEVYRDKLLLGINPVDRAEVRRLVAWFDAKMNHEVTENLVGEKIMKRFLGFGQPNSSAIRAGKANIGYHLDYIGYLGERRRWLAGDHFSLADIAAAAHLSALDYLGDVPWAEHEAVEIDLRRRRRRVGRQLGDAPPVLARAGRVALEPADVAALQQSQHRCRLQLEPALDVVERAVERRQRSVGRAAVDVGVGAVGSEDDGAVEVRDRRSIPLLRGQGLGAVDEQIGIVRLERQRRVEIRLGARRLVGGEPGLTCLVEGSGAL